MEAVKKWAGILLPILASVVSAVMGAGTFGIIAAGLGAVALVFGGMWAVNAYRNWKYNQAHEQGNKDAVDDHNKIIGDNQKEADEDSATFDQSKKDKDAAKEELGGGG